MLRAIFLTIVVGLTFLGDVRSAPALELSDLAPLVQLLAESDDSALQRDVLLGLRDGLRGRKRVAMPDGWAKAYARLSESQDGNVRELAVALALTFGDPQAAESLRRTIQNEAVPAATRKRAVEVLAESRTTDLAPLLQRLLNDPILRGEAIRALAAYPHQATPRLLLDRYATFTTDEKQDAIQTLASRTEFALALLEAVETKVVARGDISVVTARQLSALNDKNVTRRLQQAWGEIRSMGADRQQQIARYKGLLTPETLAAGNPSHGRLVYARTCQKCHRLYGEGGEIGPDLTGSNRANLDYILENVFDPSATIPREWRMNTVITADGRVLTGIVIQEAPEAVVLQTVNERLTLPRDEIDELQPTALSMMPEGQFETLQLQEVRDLIAYLRTQSQVPLPDATASQPGS